MRILIPAITVSVLIFTSCNSGNDKKVSNSERTEESAPAPDANAMSGIITTYIELKNALASDNDKNAANSGSELVKVLDTFGKSQANQSGETQEIIDDAKEHAEHIGSNAGNIKHQREHFQTLSEDLYDLIKTAGGKQKLYYTYCPMYNKGKGARWLSESKEIRNPYLGSEMPECGTVEEELN